VPYTKVALDFPQEVAGSVLSVPVELKEGDWPVATLGP
jgi:hypothetical protein